MFRIKDKQGAVLLEFCSSTPLKDVLSTVETYGSSIDDYIIETTSIEIDIDSIKDILCDYFDNDELVELYLKAKINLNSELTTEILPHIKKASIKKFTAILEKLKKDELLFKETLKDLTQPLF